ATDGRFGRTRRPGPPARSGAAGAALPADVSHLPAGRPVTHTIRHDAAHTSVPHRRSTAARRTGP
ncbi:hypothetical protein, partial [Streptomyces sp. 13-12-16]|uniref:hypothetical protein n=1 Tax=Streptomyces sp. 13-12-16 TaxID=1570823 RepID=UPI001C4F86F8